MRKKTILIADDEPDIRALVKALLNKDFTVIEAGDGNEAVKVAMRYSPDLILMDIIMPGVDGYTACSVLKKQKVTKPIPVVMATGVGFSLNKRLSKEVGADGYITKPFNLNKLLTIINQFLKDS